jgi:hypothetical protein
MDFADSDGQSAPTPRPSKHQLGGMTTLSESMQLIVIIVTVSFPFGFQYVIGDDPTVRIVTQDRHHW